MGSFPPLQLALFIVGTLAAIGVAIAYMRTRMTYAGYEDIFHDIRKLGSSMNGEIFRDGSDVVISGTWEKNPVVVRFSNQESTPGLNIRMPAAAQFPISVTPAGTPVSEGPRSPVKTTDDVFDARFTTRSDQAMQARMLLTKPVIAVLHKLACSKNTFLSIGGGCIEQSELTIPDTAAQHVLDHLKSMASLAAALRNMPGADKVKILKIEHERHVLTRLTLAAGVVVAIGSVVAAVRVPPSLPTGVNETLNNGILPTDAVVISNAAAWHAAGPHEMESAGIEMLRAYGLAPSGRVAGDFSGTATGQDVAYLLVNGEGKKRVVIIGSHQNRYDVSFNNIAMIARVPKDAVASIRWRNDNAPAGVAGDGLLIVRQPEVAESGVVVFLAPEGIKSFTPRSWHDVQLK